MKNKKKFNKIKLIIPIIILLFIYPTSVFGRYIYNIAMDSYLASKEFYFESDILDVNNPEYNYAEWSGNGTFIVDVVLYSYKNDLKKTPYDLQYTLSCSTTADCVTCGVENTATQSSKTGIIDATSENATNLVREHIYLRRNPEVDITEVENIVIDVVATATGTGNDGEKYSKTIKAKILLEINTNAEIQVVDSPGDYYATLIVKNLQNFPQTISLNWNPDILRIDSNENKYMLNKDIDGHVDATTANVIVTDKSLIDGNTIINKTTVTSTATYVSKLIFELEAETVKKIKFYKTDFNADYTYPNGTDDCVINISLDNY